MPKTHQPSARPARDEGTHLPIRLPEDSYSIEDALTSNPEFQLAWDNDIGQHVAENVLQLRRYRDWSQSDVAEKMGTSQSAIARIEGGAENITIATLQRLVAALAGRIYVMIQPAEWPFQRPRNWWDLLAPLNQWTARFSIARETAEGVQVVVGLESSAPTTARWATQLNE